MTGISYNAPLSTYGLLPSFRNPRGFPRGAFPWKKIRNPGAVGRITHQFAITLNPRGILPEKAQGIWGDGATHIFLGKHKDSGPGSGRSHDIQIYTQSEPEAHSTWKTEGFSAGGGGGYINKEQRWGCACVGGMLGLVEIC